MGGKTGGGAEERQNWPCRRGACDGPVSDLAISGEALRFGLKFTEREQTLFLLRNFEANPSGFPSLRTRGSYLHMQAQILTDPWVMVLRLLELL